MVTTGELRELADKLEGEWLDNIKPDGLKKVKFQINIINKQPKCSDTWEIEK